MTQVISRALVEDFYKAYVGRDVARVASYLDDAVEWSISGPVDVLPFCGKRSGKAAVLEMLSTQVPEVFRVFSFVAEMMLIDGDRVAALNRLSARREDGRVISYRLAHFIQFREGKIISNIALIDSFDAVEQVLGHPLTAHETQSETDLNGAVNKDGAMII